MNVFELFGTIAIKNRDANAAISDTTQKAERAGNKIQAAFKKIGDTSMKIAKPIIAGATAAATAITATVEKTREYRTSMAQLEAAFVTNNHSAETAYKTYKALYAVLGETDTAVEAANLLSLMCKNEEDLIKWTDILTGVYAKLPDSLPIESLAESANETAKVGQVTGSLADALNWCGISEDDFNKKLKACTSEEKRQKLIMDTLYWTYKAASDQYKETGANVMKANEAQEKLNSAMAKLGDIAEPIVSGVKSWIADMVTASIPYLESMIKKFEETGSIWESFIYPLLQVGWETLKGWIDGAITSLQTFIQTNVPDNYLSAAKEAWESVNGLIQGAIDLTSQFMESLSSAKAQAGALSIQSGYSTGGIVGAISSALDTAWWNPKNLFGNKNGTEISNNGAGRSFASGLDRVPNDGYIARLHKNEAVLNSRDAAEWRSGGSGRVESLLSELVNIMRAGQVIQLDSGIMAGQLTPAIDARLGTVASRKGRGS